MYTMSYRIDRRSNTRRCAFTWKSLQAVLDRNSLEYHDVPGNMVKVVVSFDDRAAAVAFRKHFEAELLVIDRNIFFMCDITKTA